MPDVAPGEIALFTNQIPPEAKAWKVPFIWAEQPSRFQFIRARLKMKASSLFGGSASTNKVEFVLKLHTNYSAEFPR